MRTRYSAVAGVIAAAAIAAGGCMLTAPNRPTTERMAVGNAPAFGQVITARPDSVPGPNPPPPPSPQPSISVQFTGADTVTAGQTSVTRWLFGNGGHSSITIAWTLSNDLGCSAIAPESSAMAVLNSLKVEPIS